LGSFLPARPLTQGDLAALTERVRRRVIRWFRMQRLLDAAAAADVLALAHSGFSIDASVRITLVPPQLRVYFQSLEHLLRYCAQPLTKIHAAGGQRRHRAHAVCRQDARAAAQPNLGFGCGRPSQRWRSATSGANSCRCMTTATSSRDR
jgi:hypothetical protein